VKVPRQYMVGPEEERIEKKTFVMSGGRALPGIYRLTWHFVSVNVQEVLTALIRGSGRTRTEAKNLWAGIEKLLKFQQGGEDEQRTQDGRSPSKDEKVEKKKV